METEGGTGERQNASLLFQSITVSVSHMKMYGYSSGLPKPTWSLSCSNGALSRGVEFAS